MNKELINIDIESVKIQKTIRTNMGDLDSLEQSIKNVGLLSPVIIDEQNNLIAGARRLQAARNVGLDQIAAFKLHIACGSMEAMDIQSDENLCRLELSADDLANHIDSKVKTGCKTKPVKKIFNWLSKLFS